MAIPSTRGTKITIDQMAILAWKRAGLLEIGTPTTDPGVAEKLSYARSLMDMVLDQLVNVADARFVDFHDVTCSNGIGAYTLPEEIIDVVNDGVYIAASEASTETPSSQTIVKQVNIDEWHTMTAKNSTGTPTLMYPHRGTEDVHTISLKLWPIPVEAGTVRILAQRPPADTFVGSETLDLKGGIYAYVLHELAGQLCESGNGSEKRAKSLMDKAKELKREARIFAAYHGKVRIHIMARPAPTRSR